MRNTLDKSAKMLRIFEILLKNAVKKAMFFHPIYRGKVLSEQQHQQAKNYVFEHLDADGLESLHQFTAG